MLGSRSAVVVYMVPRPKAALAWAWRRLVKEAGNVHRPTAAGGRVDHALFELTRRLTEGVPARADGVKYLWS